MKEEPRPSCWPCFTPPNGVVVVKVVSATGLEKQDSLGCEWFGGDWRNRIPLAVSGEGGGDELAVLRDVDCEG